MIWGPFGIEEQTIPHTNTELADKSNKQDTVIFISPLQVDI